MQSPMQSNDSRFYSLPQQVLFFSLAVLFAWLISNAQIREDGYITFRTLDNFIQGHGLRWNGDERVQTYTAPLWLLIHIPFYYFWENVALVTILLSLATTAFAVGIAFKTFDRTPLVFACLWVIPFALSKTLIDYSVSGLENPLSNALFGWFCWILLKAKKERFWFWLSLCTALSMTNRQDTLIIYLPVWCYLLCAHRREIRWTQLLVGALPIVAWEAFSLFYYGSPFPNTKYAKLHTGLSMKQHMWLGWRYFGSLVWQDFNAALWVIAAILAAPLLLVCYIKTRNQRLAYLLGISLGIFAYTFYIISIGGTHTLGRFWTLHVYASLWLVLAMVEKTPGTRPLVVFTAILIVVALFYASFLGLRKGCVACVTSPHHNAFQGIDYLLYPKAVPKPRVRHSKRVLVIASIGAYCFKFDAATKVIDPIAIGDPLLARLPIIRSQLRDMGTLYRPMPKGYIHARHTNGDLSKMDPDLAEYYGKMRFIITGELWSWERVREIIKFNLGEYDYLRDRYVARTQPGKMRKENSG